MILLFAFPFSLPHLSFSLHQYFFHQGGALRVEQAGPRASKGICTYILRGTWREGNLREQNQSYPLWPWHL